MSARYPNMLFIRISQEDKELIEKASEKEDIPTSTLARKILRQWLQHSIEAHPSAIEKRPIF